MPREKEPVVPKYIQPRFLRTEDAERYLGLAPGTLKIWQSQGSCERTRKVPPPRQTKPSDGITLYDIRDLDEWGTNLPRKQTP